MFENYIDNFDFTWFLPSFYQPLVTYWRTIVHIRPILVSESASDLQSRNLPAVEAWRVSWTATNRGQEKTRHVTVVMKYSVCSREHICQHHLLATEILRYFLRRARTCARVLPSGGLSSERAYRAFFQEYPHWKCEIPRPHGLPRRHGAMIRVRAQSKLAGSFRSGETRDL